MRKLSVKTLLLISLTAPITLLGMKDKDLETSNKIATVLLQNEDVNLYNLEGQKKHTIVAWFWRGDNYVKPCSHKELERYREQIVTLKEIQKKHENLEKQGNTTWLEFKTYCGACTSNDLLLALRIFALLPDQQSLLERVAQHLYGDIGMRRRLLEPIKIQLKKFPLSIVDFYFKKIATYEVVHKKIKNKKSANIVYNHENINFFAQDAAVLIPFEGKEDLVVARTADGKVLTEITVDATMLKKDREIPVVEGYGKKGENGETIFTKDAFTLILDPTNKKIEFKVSEKTKCSIEYHNMSQFAYDSGVFVCAPPLYPGKKELKRDALIADFNSGNYFLLDRPQPQKSLGAGPLYPEAFCKNGISFINWHDQIDAFCAKTNTMVSQKSNNFIETMQISPDGNYLLTCEKLSGNKKMAKYAYHLLSIILQKVSLLDHVKSIAKREKSDLGQFAAAISGIGFGKTSFREKGIEKERINAQHGEDNEFDKMFETLPDVPTDDGEE